MNTLSLRDRCIHWLLSRFFPFRDITKVSDKGHLYLRRYFITKKKPGSDKRIFVHFIARSDDDRDLHDHPWSFVSYILLGGYREETFEEGLPGMPTEFKTYGIGHKLIRPATWAHRLHLKPNQPAWTLIFRSGRKRVWGFWQDGVHVPWNIYLGVNEEFDEDMEKVSQ